MRCRYGRSYTGFDFAFPTLNMEMEAVSGPAIIGPFSDIMHVVGGGTGVCMMCIYCQHENIVVLTGQCLVEH
jgi:hypothetical protein